MTPRTVQVCFLLLCFVQTASQEAVDLALATPEGSWFHTGGLIQGALLHDPDSLGQDGRSSNGAGQQQWGPIGSDQALTAWNAMVLLAMLAVVGKVMMAPSGPEAAGSEDMSIGKSLPIVLLWCCLGMILVCFNKYLYLTIDKGGFGFPFPMSLTWWHMFTGMVTTNIIRLFRPELMPAVHEGKLTRHQFLTSVVPIGMVYAAYLALGNTAYMYLSVSFIQMLKSAGPMSVFAISVAFGFERMTTAAVVSLVIVVLGVAGATVGEMAFSWLGFALQFTAFVCDGLRLVLFKGLMSSHGSKLDPLSALYYFSPVCVVSLILPVWHYEAAMLIATLRSARLSLYCIIVVNGLIAFSLNASLLALFKRASPTTVSMASVIRDIALTFGSAIVFHTEITRVQILGYLSACLGVKLWDEIKARPDAFYRAFKYERSDRLPMANARCD